MKGVPIRSLADAWMRGLGVLIVALGLWLHDDGLPRAIAGLALPMLFALGALLVLRNVAAVGLGAGLLALVRSDFNGDWIAAAAYPAIAAAGLGISAGIYWARFRRSIRNTHAARWRPRRR